MTFICRERAWIEGLVGPPYSHARGANTGIWDKLWTANNLSRDIFDPDPALSTFREMLDIYTRRDLTLSTDALNAVAGVLQHLSYQIEPVFNFTGLPYYRGQRYSNKIFTIEETIGFALSWSSAVLYHEDYKRREAFPSWTWAGWTGRVSWSNALRHIWFLRDIALEAESGAVIDLPETRNTAAVPWLKNDLERVKTISFKSHSIPAASFQEEQNEVKLEGNSMLYENWFPLTEQKKMVQKVREGRWFCLVLGAKYFIRNRETSRKPYDDVRYKVLVCRRVGGISAERMYCVTMSIEGAHEIDSFEASLESRRVRLV